VPVLAMVLRGHAVFYIEGQSPGRIRFTRCAPQRYNKVSVRKLNVMRNSNMQCLLMCEDLEVRCNFMLFSHHGSSKQGITLTGARVPQQSSTMLSQQDSRNLAVFGPSERQVLTAQWLVQCLRTARAYIHLLLHNLRGMHFQA